ncbi:MAG: GcrA family cell cycle regulator [Alphaproteobacteria bacterium]|nr:GcrA family cell cycle regulator [Alphaproteobacteria bacterium]
MAAIGWTPSVLNKMKSLLERGMSTAEIGKKIGMSKNAVVGKLNRLGWTGKGKESPAKKTPAKKEIVIKVKPAKKAAPKKTPAQVAQEKKAALAAAAKDKKTAAGKTPSKKNLVAHQHMIQHAMELAMLRPDQCRWPIGNPDSDKFHFCGEKVFPGKPYCYEHCRAAYQMMPPPKKQ